MGLDSFMNLNAEKNIRTFFNKYFYRQHPEAALRYLPVVSEIKKAKLEDSKILEIGSGSLGITPYFNKKIEGVDIEFSGPQTDQLVKIEGSAVNLQFRKNSQDVTISVDLIEHIPAAMREKAIFDMLKITKKLVIVVVPVGEESEKQDKELQAHWKKIFKDPNQFLDEHVQNGLPKTDEILVYIDRSLRKLGKNAKTTSYPNLNLKIRKLLMLSWITKNKFLYYFYLKGLLLFVPILRNANFGKTYRRVFVIEFTPKNT